MEMVQDKMKVVKYESYKDSGVEWLGEIPEHWDLLPGFTVVEERKEKNIGMIENVVLSLSYGNVIIKPEEKLTGLVPESFETYQIVHPGDIIIRPTDLQNDKTSLRTGLSKNKGIITSAYLNLKVKEKYSQIFYHYYLHSIDTNKVIYQLGSGLRQNLDYRDFKRFPFVVPPLPEQTAIAQFLDRKTALIDQAIAQKEQLIELLQERRQILIHRAVTRGLDPEVELKDSGVEWIGKIPKHWEVKKLNYVCNIFNGTTPSRGINSYWENGSIPWIASGKVNDYYVEEPSEWITQRALKDCSLNIVPKNSIIMGMIGQGKTRGTVAYLNIDTCINQNLAAIIPQFIKPKYLFFFLQSIYKPIREYARGGNQEGLNCQLISNLKILYPPIKEQVEIIGFLKKIRDDYKKAIKLKQQEIQTLKEYKTTLIDAAVTGKIKVS